MIKKVKSRGGVGPSKNWVTWGGGVRNFLLEREGKPEKGGVDVEMRGCHFFSYFTVQSHLLYMLEK